MKVFSMPPEKHEISVRSLGTSRVIRTTFKTQIPQILGDVASSIGTREIDFGFAIPSDYPNQMFASAIDLNTIKKDIMERDLHRLNAEELEDQEAFMALSNEIISDLLDEEPDIYTLDDVKVRFR